MADTILNTIIKKIDNKTITCEDINELIKGSMINETTPESIRDRIRRRVLKTNTRTHLDKDGHSKLKTPDFAKRTHPKRKPENQQNHGRSRIAHKHSERTQKRIYEDEIQFVINNIGKTINESDINRLNKENLHKVAVKLMSKPNINRDWLNDLCSMIRG